MLYYFISAIENKDDRCLAERLYLSNRQMVYKISLGFLRNEHRAEDAVCDVFERVCKNISQFHNLECNKQTALIVTYSKNLLIDVLRRDKIISFDKLDDTVAERHCTDDIVIDQSSYEDILGIFNTLGHKYTAVCKLKYFVGLSDAEIARVLGITPENVRVRLHRSRDAIRKQLIKEGEMI